MESIPFIKASACGNDFLLIDLARLPRGGDLAAVTRRLCDRHDGVGADGVEWLSEDAEADVRARLVNADGSPAEISGNGTRCVAAYITLQQSLPAVDIRTDAGIKTCTLTAQEGNRFEFETAMGEPQVGDPFTIKLAFGEITGVPVSMGNPHFVVFVDEFVPGWQAEAAEIGRHHDFKYGINVELVKIKNQSNIEVMFFERGVGETRSSGTGSCAAAVASIFIKRAQSPVNVHTQGGVQTVRWEGEVFLRGSAQLVCRGEFFI
ncbi:MAG: diaminopimelate epimerase [Terriglobales bacterium]